ncbi:MAG: hypothetical protein HY261_10610, partial [Chloroflexi bacterium]|nr:hypothetical protein [Chloroflexota bacterium]
VTAFTGPILAGFIKDATGEYLLAFSILAAGTAVGIPLILLSGDPNRRATAVGAPA